MGMSLVRRSLRALREGGNGGIRGTLRSQGDTDGRVEEVQMEVLYSYLPEVVEV